MFLHPSVGSTEQFFGWGCRHWLHSNPCSFLAVLHGEILCQCAQLWFLYVYFCSSRRCPSAAVISHMLHIGTFHRFRRFFSYGRLSSETYNICPCWLNSLISIMRTICWCAQEVLCHRRIAYRNAHYRAFLTCKDQVFACISSSWICH